MSPQQPQIPHTGGTAYHSVSEVTALGLDAPPVAVPTKKSQEMVLVRRAEISALKRGVSRAFENPVESAFAWASAWLGIAVAAGFSLLALTGVEGNHIRSGVLAAHWAALIGGLFLAGYLAWIGRQNRKRRTTARDDVLHELDELNTRAPTQFADEEAG